MKRLAAILPILLSFIIGSTFVHAQHEEIPDQSVQSEVTDEIIVIGDVSDAQPLQVQIKTAQEGVYRLDIIDPRGQKISEYSSAEVLSENQTEKHELNPNIFRRHGSYQLLLYRDGQIVRTKRIMIKPTAEQERLWTIPAHDR